MDDAVAIDAVFYRKQAEEVQRQAKLFGRESQRGLLTSVGESLDTVLAVYHVLVKAQQTEHTPSPYDFANTYIYRGRIHSLLGEFNEAHSCYEAAAMICKGYEGKAAGERGRAYVLQGDLEMARTAFEIAQKADPSNSELVLLHNMCDVLENRFN